MSSSAPEKPTPPQLRRSLTLPLLVLYGLGTTIGAGIYVLIGVTAERAGMYAPVAFIVAGVVMVFSAGSFAEFARRHPVSAGEAAYTKAGFGSPMAGTLVGMIVIVESITAAAAIALGSTGYIEVFVDLPGEIVIAAVVLAMGAVAAAGILESVLFASIMTLIEVAGLVAILAGGFGGDPGMIGRLGEVFPGSFDPGVWSGIFGAGLLAFFAFIGFEDMVNVAEETREPEKTMPVAIFLTLGIVMAIYFLVAAVTVLSVPIGELAASNAPLGLVFERVTSLPPQAISAIAIVATLNGVIIQMILASRVIYGLASAGSLPKGLGRVNRMTRTPLVATALVAGAVLVLALGFDLEGLAETTSRLTLLVFVLVNA
ncbi:MAG: amino acid permease, partial [Cucumibacter sp.]